MLLLMFCCATEKESPLPTPESATSLLFVLELTNHFYIIDFAGSDDVPSCV